MEFIIQDEDGNRLSPETVRAPTPQRLKSSITEPSQMNSFLSAKSHTSQRRGHHHKHSLSHQFFLPPKNRQPLELPTAYPIPTWKELWLSMGVQNQIKAGSSLLFFALALGVFMSGEATVLLALSFSLMFEGVLVLTKSVRKSMDSFVVWRGTCLRYPFGLQQLELLLDFSLSVILLFLGLNLLKEPAEHAIEEWGNMDPGADEKPHIHLTLSLILSVIVSGLSMLGKQPRSHVRMLNHRFFHGLTFVPAVILMVLLLLGIPVGSVASHIFALSIAVTAVVVGFSIAKRLGIMLLQTYPSSESLTECIELIRKDARISNVDSVSIWQPHYNTCIANFSLSLSMGERGQATIRSDVTRIVQQTLGTFYGAGLQPKWEVTVQIKNISPSDRLYLGA
ncbi:cation diffusion family zinc membrane transporter Zrg17 [Schizosaccharomyces japonicus yFS275]|uniref:Cation diffusion family zinc membrane transporter Zrg17 n=1 Tax=Schizosaccharomyces japonicus (strain yFS275 / FY16936) TaxID=402676 RepID=B6K4G8_SCHJY|nr:cation diffusion family zinc membrane transporter Zrg17 [Schizosaccharomyces japonicus yFS275]EEB08375.1 cation diffusion family zinc membrane transporter Zrg17 [Schizosaccharomyces japonicus yFS275]